MATRKRIMRTFKLNEISAVDNPAQVHARAVLLKRADARQEHDMDLTKIASFDSFDDAINAIAKRDGCARHEAMTKARTRHPALYEAYQREGDGRVAKQADADRPRPVSKAELAFQDRVDEIAMSRRLPRHAAMSAARQRYPDEFAAAYERET
jgi:hypothetical protein